jgi:hypothetical protein
MGHPFSLGFDPFAALVLLLSVMHSAQMINDAESHWLEGLQLVVTYFMCALGATVRVGGWADGRGSMPACSLTAHSTHRAPATNHRHACCCRLRDAAHAESPWPMPSPAELRRRRQQRRGGEQHWGVCAQRHRGLWRVPNGFAA